MGKKALFFDIDGTLFDTLSGKLPESAFIAAKKARENGHLLFINTGRTYCMADYIRRQVGMEGMICGCGTHIVIGDEEIMQYVVPLERDREIKEALLKTQTDAVLEGAEGLYCYGRPLDIDVSGDTLVDEMKANPIVYQNCKADEPGRFNKLCTYIDPDNPEQRYDEFLDFLDDFYHIKRTEYFHECVPKGFTKGTGIQYVLEKYGISPHDAYAFGDSNNDEEMFACGVSNKIVMKTHSKELDRFNPYVTDDVLDNGIYNAMKYFGLI